MDYTRERYILIYADESGNPNFKANDPKAGNYFSFGFVLLKPDNMDGAKPRIDLENFILKAHKECPVRPNSEYFHASRDAPAVRKFFFNKLKLKRNKIFILLFLHQ